jgi:uncharacterized protein (DUF305 family)
LKRYTSFGLLALLIAVSLALTSCAGAGSSSAEQGSEEQESGEQGSEESADAGQQGMDHESMGHGDMGSEGAMAASEMLMENGEYSDERFIDAMVPHHQGAIDMAEVALENAEHPELLQLAQNVISTQQAEIEELRSIKEQEFGTSEVPTQMSPEEMEMMGMEDPAELANQRPFDLAFISAMIQHHESAIEMAQVALAESENPRIRELAASIVEDQEAEIAQMTEWGREWYPGG